MLAAAGALLLPLFPCPAPANALVLALLQLCRLLRRFKTHETTRRQGVRLGTTTTTTTTNTTTTTTATTATTYCNYLLQLLQLLLRRRRRRRRRRLLLLLLPLRRLLLVRTGTATCTGTEVKTRSATSGAMQVCQRL